MTASEQQPAQVARGVMPERYRALDTLRGVAAVVVVLYHADALFHLGGWSPPLSFLAVDIFFCLSGFVLAKSYDRRFAAGMSAWQFMWLRLRRLYPLYALGFATAYITTLLPGSEPMASATALTLGLNALMLPGVERMFPANPPSWSLFFEFWVANLALAFGWRLLRGINLLALIAVAAVGLVMAERIYHNMNLGFEWPTFLGGHARVMFSFFAGVALARFHDRKPSSVQVPAGLLVVILFALLSLPVAERLRQAHQLLCILLGFPILVYLGASAPERRPALGAILGDASYALYVMHWPMLVLGIAMVRWGGYAPAGAGLQLGLTMAIVLLALVLHHRYDAPVRAAFARLGRRR